MPGSSSKFRATLEKNLLPEGAPNVKNQKIILMSLDYKTVFYACYAHAYVSNERYAFGFTLKRENLLLPQNGDMYARNQTGSYKGVSFVSFKPSVP